MQLTFKLNLLLLVLFSFTFGQSMAQDKEQQKKDKKTAKIISKIENWECEKLQKDGREIDIKAIAGEVFMTFTSRVEKKKEEVTRKNGKKKMKKVKETINSFKMEMGGNDRIFNYRIESDSIRFDGVKGFNDYRIVRAEKDELVLEQDLDSSLFRWTLTPKPKKKK